MTRSALALGCALIPLLGSGILASPAIQLGPGHGYYRPQVPDPPCDGDLLLTYDGTAENGYAWSFGGIQPPDWGSFAEGFVGTGTVCGMQLHLTTNPGYYQDQPLDVYVYASDGENPSEVLAVDAGLHVSPPGLWPEVTIHDLPLPPTPVEDDFFVSWWGNWPGERTGWYIAASTNGPAGMPRAKYAPGIGYPTGWGHVSLAFGPTRTIGIGAYLGPTMPTASETLRWGAIKALFQNP